MHKFTSYYIKKVTIISFCGSHYSCSHLSHGQFHFGIRSNTTYLFLSSFPSLSSIKLISTAHLIYNIQFLQISKSAYMIPRMFSSSVFQIVAQVFQDTPSLYTTQYHYITESHSQETRCRLCNSMTTFS